MFISFKWPLEDIDTTQKFLSLLCFSTCLVCINNHHLGLLFPQYLFVLEIKRLKNDHLGISKLV